MKLYLTRSWEHALLARVVKEAAQVSQEDGGYLGRTALQKIAYFLQVRGVPMRYRFEVCHFGPFCSEILDDTEWLAADAVVVDKSPQTGKYSKFAPGPACDALLGEFSEQLGRFEEIVTDTVKALLPLEPRHLELIATLDYAFREMKGTLGKKPPKSKVLARFRDFKADKFTVKEVEETYERLESAGLFT
jgi:uncharacterized protein YwgA